MEENLVSIIIPLFNREKLIKETLNSILDQENYNNWECLIVDDHSTDKSYTVARQFSKKDPRIKAFKRPDKLPKGANSCRNFGFAKSTGKYIIWFDSDDLMTSDHIEAKLRFIEGKKLDFVVARTQNFENDRMLEPYIYDRKEYGIKASEFVLLNIHWYTYDVMLKREIAAKISWNEHMKSWQDYNYFCKMLLKTEKGDYLDRILTHRRIHSNSIQKTLNQNSSIFNKELLENRVLTYNDISEEIDDYTRKELVFGMMNLSFNVTKAKNWSSQIPLVFQIVYCQLGHISKFYFSLSLLTSYFIGKGYYFLQKAKCA